MTNINNIKELDSNNFSDAIKTGLVLVDFWAPWCGPCRLQGPILEDVSKKIGNKASIAKVNVDEHPDVAALYGIVSIPTLILFKDGNPVNQFVGVQNEAKLISILNTY